MSATKLNRFILFAERIAARCDYDTKYTAVLDVQNVEFYCVQAGGAYGDQWTSACQLYLNIALFLYFHCEI
jgi:hypothetical protein